MKKILLSLCLLCLGATLPPQKTVTISLLFPPLFSGDARYIYEVWHNTNSIPPTYSMTFTGPGATKLAYVTTPWVFTTNWSLLLRTNTATISIPNRFQNELFIARIFDTNLNLYGGWATHN